PLRYLYASCKPSRVADVVIVRQLWIRRPVSIVRIFGGYVVPANLDSLVREEPTNIVPARGPWQVPQPPLDHHRLKPAPASAITMGGKNCNGHQPQYSYPRMSHGISLSASQPV